MNLSNKRKIKKSTPKVRNNTEGGYSNKSNESRNKALKSIANQYKKELTKKATKAEKRFRYLLNHCSLKINYHFQYIIYVNKRYRIDHFYIVDFYLPEYKIAIEIDGGYHNSGVQEYRDKVRTKELNRLGIKVIRYSNDEILNISNKETFYKQVLEEFINKI